jgi:hypothetical protein
MAQRLLSKSFRRFCRTISKFRCFKSYQVGYEESAVGVASCAFNIRVVIWVPYKVKKRSWGDLCEFVILLRGFYLKGILTEVNS